MSVGSASPFDVLSLSDSLSGISEDGIGDIFVFFHSFNPTSKLSSSMSAGPPLLLLRGVSGGGVGG